MALASGLYWQSSTRLYVTLPSLLTALFKTNFNAKSAPVLVLHGAMDSTVAPRHAEYLNSILNDAKAPHEFQMYPTAGHSFERGNFDAEAAADAWQRSLRFFNTTLKK